MSARNVFSVITLSAGLHDRTKKLLGGFLPGDIRQGGEITMNRFFRADLLVEDPTFDAPPHSPSIRCLRHPQ